MDLVKRLDHIVKRLALDEPHRVERALVAISSQCVDRDNIGMFETTRDLGLADEPGPAALMLHEFGPDPLDGDHAIQLLIVRDEDLAQTSLGVRLDEAEPPPAFLLGGFSEDELENLGFDWDR